MYTHLLDHCTTDRQRQVIEALIRHDSQRLAAEEIGLSRSMVRQTIDRVRLVAAAKGEAPEAGLVAPVPEGFAVQGTSTLFDKRDGSTIMQWVKTSREREMLEAAIRESLEALKEEIPPVPAVPEPTPCNSDLLNLYVITDYHLGARAWPEETRDAPWDTHIAEDMLVRWFGEAIKRSPDAETAVLAQLGDFLDHDGLIPVTPTSGHVMDADSRFQLLARVAIRVMRKVIGMLLKKHQRVHVIMAEGNHDISSSVWLREGFYALYEDEPRVTIDRSADPYYCYEHGDTSLFFHHGHMRKPKDIDAVFASKFREVFGRTKHSFAHLGHMHHVDTKETTLMIVEQHRTLAARNAHESRHGWGSGRDAKVVTYHREHGRVGEQVIGADMVG